MGITGASQSMNSELPQMLQKIKKHTKLPLAVGFGVSNHEHYKVVQEAGADAVVVGSKIINIINESGMLIIGLFLGSDYVNKVQEFCSQLCDLENKNKINSAKEDSDSNVNVEFKEFEIKAEGTRFGEFGGQFVPEALFDCLCELEMVILNINDRRLKMLKQMSHFGRNSEAILAIWEDRHHSMKHHDSQNFLVTTTIS